METIYQISQLHEMINIVRNRTNINPVYRKTTNNTSEFYRFHKMDSIFKKMLEANSDYELIAEWNMDYLVKIGLIHIEYSPNWFAENIDLFRSFYPLHHFMSTTGIRDVNIFDSDEKLKAILLDEYSIFSKEHKAYKIIKNICKQFDKIFKNSYALREQQMRYSKHNILKLYTAPHYLKLADVEKLELMFHKYDRTIEISRTPITI